MRGRVPRPSGMLLVGAGLIALVAGSVADDQSIRARTVLDAPTGGVMASVDDSLAQMPEVWAATDPGDQIPTVANEVGPAPAPAPAAAAAASAAPPLVTRIPKPVLPAGSPRRVGIQAGHWLTEQAPPELWRLIAQTGTSWNGVREVDINLDVAERIQKILQPKGILVDVLPTVIPPGYVADAFVALHGDGDGTGENSGFKMAYSSRRTPYEADLLDSIKSTYGATTGLDYDPLHVSRAMVNYYAMSWQRNKYATAPHTPSVILEMGYVSNDSDRELMTDHADVVAGAIAQGILDFLAGHPRDKLFGQDLLVPATPVFAPPSPRPAG